MAQFNPNKIKAFTDFLELQNDLKLAQTSYENAKNMEVVTDTIMGMGMVSGAAAQKQYMKSRNRKLLLVGMVLAGGAYLYNKTNKNNQVIQESLKSIGTAVGNTLIKKENSQEIPLNLVEKQKNEVPCYEK